MFHQIYKILLVSIICGSLVGLHSPLTYAQEKGITTTDKDGVVTVRKNYQFKPMEDADALTSLGMLAGGFITGRMLHAYTPLTKDVMIAGAAGALFIAGEIMSNVKFKGTIESMQVEIEKRSDGKINEEQIQRLQDLRKSYEEAKKTTSTKKTLQLAAAAAFGVAALMSTYMALTEEGLTTACRSYAASAKAKLTTCAGSTIIAPSEAAQCAACLPILATYMTNFEAFKMARRVPGPTQILDKKTAVPEAMLVTPEKYCGTMPSAVTKGVAMGMAGTCVKATQVQIIDQVSANLKRLISSAEQNSLLDNLLNHQNRQLISYDQMQSRQPTFYIEKALDYFFPRAEASWLPLLGLGAGVAAAFIPMTATVAAQIDTMMYIPMHRAVTFGALAGVAFLASRSSENVMQEIDQNIAKIDTILDDMSKLVNGVKAQNLMNHTVKLQTIKTGPQTMMSLSKDGNTKSPCMTSNSAENCKPLQDQLATMPGFANLPESVRTVASQTAGLGDSLSGTTGISSSTITGAANLGSKYAVINKALKAKQAQISKLSKGKIDLEKDQQKFLKDLGSKIRKDLEKKGTTASGLMASIGATPIAPSKETTPDKESPTASNVGEISLAAGTSDKAVSSEAADKDEGIKLEFNQEVPNEYAANSGAVAGATENYDMKTGEIGKEDGPSIFEVISSRYRKSGYPKLLEEEPVKN